MTELLLLRPCRIKSVGIYIILAQPIQTAYQFAKVTQLSAYWSVWRMQNLPVLANDEFSRYHKTSRYLMKGVNSPRCSAMIAEIPRLSVA